MARKGRFFFERRNARNPTGLGADQRALAKVEALQNPGNIQAHISRPITLTGQISIDFTHPVDAPEL
jgi:hypothetical protein